VGPWQFVRWILGLTFALLPFAGEAAAIPVSGLDGSYMGPKLSPPSSSNSGFCVVGTSVYTGCSLNLGGSNGPLLSVDTAGYGSPIGTVSSSGAISITDYCGIFQGAIIQSSSGTATANLTYVPGTTCVIGPRPTTWTATRQFNPSNTSTTTSTTGTSSSTSLPPPPTTQTAYTVSIGKIPDAVIAVSATGTYDSANVTVTLDILDVLQAVPTTGFAAAGYNVYVVALIPGAVLRSASPVWFVKPQAPNAWRPLSSPIAAYLVNVDQTAINNQVIVQILASTDVTSLRGTEIYLGYGLSDTEMLSSGRYRGVYKVQ
jgi:hypothetical protein